MGSTSGSSATGGNWVRDWVHEIVETGPLQVNTQLLGHRDRGEAVLVDPGGDADLLLQRLAALSLRLTHIINTHGHFDHIGAVATLQQQTGCQFWIHEADAALVTAAPRHAATWGMPPFGPVPRMDRSLHHGEVLEVAGLAIGVIHTPGHTQGGVCLQVGDRVVVGDTLFAGAIGRTDLPGGNHAQLLRSIRDRLLCLPDTTTCYPGHGPSTTIGRERRSNPFLGALE